MRQFREIPNHLLFIFIVALGLLASCTVGPDYVPPDPELADTWHQELTRGLAEGEANLQTWWTLLDDPVLKRLIERATEGNLDLRMAYARVQEARALRGVARGDVFPLIEGTGSYTRARSSEETVPDLPPDQSRTEDFFQGGFDASWEIDIFGRIRRSVEAADASLEASVEGFRDVLVVLYAEIARSYVEIRSLQARIRYALANVESQRGTLQLTRNRVEAQIAPELDAQQAELNLARTESLVPTLRALLAAEIHRLGVFLGEPPGALFEELAGEVEIPSPPEEIIVGLPASLLRQRPDIREAERNLAAQTARIGVATAALYPRFSLSGTFALEALEFPDMWDQKARSYGFGPSFRWNIFDGGRIRNNIRAEDARARQALAIYERTVLDALEEVESSMVAFVQERERRDILERSVTAAERSAELVRILYTTGLTDFQNVLDMERSLAEQQDALAGSDGLVTQNLIRIYRALGGGWAPEAGTRGRERGGEPDAG